MSPEDVPENHKTGTMWTAVGHIFCAVVGAGVLGLPNSLAWLGWVAGPICLCAFFGVSLLSAVLLSRLYRVDGIEFSRYHHLVSHVLGRWGSIAVAAFQMLNLVLSDIAYTITGAIAMRTIAGYLGTQPTKQWQFALIMGALELFLSQVPSLEEIWWVSALGTASSLGYVAVALVLGLVYGGNRLGSIGGRPGTSTANKVFGVLNSLGNIAFAFGFAQVLLEIQDTLRQPPKAEKTMGKAVITSTISAFALYISSAVACYAALGDSVPGEVLQGFEMAPKWVMLLANFCIVVHMVTAYQVWAQPMFETIESHVKARALRRQQAQLDGAAHDPPTSAKLDKLGEEDVEGHRHAAHLPRMSDEALEGGLSQDAPAGAMQAMHSQGSLALHGSGLSSGAGSMHLRRLSFRGSGGMVVYNSAPLPDLMPKGWLPRAHASYDSLQVAARPSKAGSSASADHAHPHQRLHRQSVLSTLGSSMGSQAMYHLDTGAANEHVPLNDQGYLLPLWQRLALRSAYVLVCTMVACVVPFFSAVVGLVGAVTFWPLSIGFPFAMYIKVFKPRRNLVTTMYTIAAIMLAVALSATVGSVQSIIASWQTYTLFD